MHLFNPHLPKQLNEVYFYGSHERQSQKTEHAKVSCYFTNKQKTRFDYRKSLNEKKIHWKCPYKTKIFFWWNMFSFLDKNWIQKLNIKILNIKMYFCNISATIHIQNQVEYLRWSCYLLITFTVSSILDARLGSNYASENNHSMILNYTPPTINPNR